jgi:hypothetical protein
MKEIATALIKAQLEMSNPKKGASNPFFKSKYADLNSVREAVIGVLNENGIAVLQPMATIDGKNYIKTMLIHSSGEIIEGFTEIIYSKQNDAQSQGSGITYARRYGLQSLVCVGADDDDGQKASQTISIEKPTITNQQIIESQIKAPERNPDLILALDDVKRSTTEDELKTVWNGWECFQSDNTFKTAVNLRKEQLKNK